MKFKASNNKTNTYKWIIYSIIGVCALIYILNYSDWHFISKFIFLFPLIINLFFDLFYLLKIKPSINSIDFTDSLLIINRKNNKNREINLSNLKYSVRKRKFDKHKTEIELKQKNGLGYKTFDRLHIKNWDNIFDIEAELENKKVQRVDWKPQTIWAKYWGIFIDLFFISVADGDLGMTDYQDKTIKEITDNPIKKQKE